jgi:hypothetical protein
MGMGKNPGMTWYDPRINGSSSPKIWYDLVNPMPSTIPKIITIFMDDRLSPKGNGIGLWQPGFPFPALIGVGDPHVSHSWVHLNKWAWYRPGIGITV